MNMPDTPHAKSCSNDHRDDHWTCPGCYNDLGNVGEGNHECPECHRKVECSVEQIPSCVTRLVEPF